MKRLELIKGLSYFTPGMSCRAEKGKPFDAEDGLADELVKTGKFAEVNTADDNAEDSTSPEEGQDNEPADKGDGADETSHNNLTEKDVDAMKMPELLSLASEHGIDLSGCGNNDERKAAIKEALFAIADPFTTEE